MFGRLYFGELKKLIKPKGLIAIAVIFVVFFILYAVVYNVDFDAIFGNMQDIIDSMGEEGEETELPGELTLEDIIAVSGYGSIDFIAYANADNIDEIIAEYTERRNDALKDKQEGIDIGGELYYCDSVLSLLNYMKKNGVYGELNVDGYDYQRLPLKSAEGFAMSYFELIVSILTIYGIVLAAGLFADEYANGTIKLLMLRPIGRNTLTTAKLLALFTHLAVISGVMTLIGFIYGAIAFDVTASRAVYVVFNAHSVFKSTVGAMTLCRMFFKFLGLLSFCTLSYMIGTLTKKKTVAIIVSIILELGLVSFFFKFLGGLDKFLFTTNTDLSIFFGITWRMTQGANFAIALPMYLVYMAAIVTALYLTVKKRDIV